MDPYVTPEDTSDLNAATTFEELKAIAFRIIRRIPQPVSMVCGPISTGGAGSIEKNLEALRRAIQGLERTGYNVFNQTIFEAPFMRIKETPGWRGEQNLLEVFYRPLFEAGLIRILHFVPSWRTSYGATWEHQQAMRLNLEIRYL